VVLKPEAVGEGRGEGSFAKASHGFVLVKCSHAMEEDAHIEVRLAPNDPEREVRLQGSHNFSTGQAIYKFGQRVQFRELVDPEERKLFIWLSAHFACPEMIPPRVPPAIPPANPPAITPAIPLAIPPVPLGLGDQESVRSRSGPGSGSQLKRTESPDGYQIAGVQASVFTKRDKQHPVSYQVPSSISGSGSLLFIVTCRANVCGEGRRQSGFANSEGGEGSIDVTLKARPNVDFKISVVLDAENTSGHGPLHIEAVHNFGTGRVFCPLQDGVRFLDYVNPADKKLHIGFRAEALPADVNRPS